MAAESGAFQDRDLDPLPALAGRLQVGPLPPDVEGLEPARAGDDHQNPQDRLEEDGGGRPGHVQVADHGAEPAQAEEVVGLPPPQELPGDADELGQLLVLRVELQLDPQAAAGPRAEGPQALVVEALDLAGEQAAEQLVADLLRGQPRRGVGSRHAQVAARLRRFPGRGRRERRRRGESGGC